MTRRELMDELKAAGVTFNTKAAKAELEKLYAEVQAQTQEKEENNMKNQNTQEVATTKAADYDAHIDLVIDTIDQAHNVEADVYPNLGDWIKIKLAGKTVLEARFGKNELRDWRRALAKTNCVYRQLRKWQRKLTQHTSW